MKKFILYLWQLPQNLIGFLIIKIMKAKIKKFYGVKKYFNCLYYDEIKYFECRLFYSGVSLGEYIIFDNRILISYLDIRHEEGHQKQSLFLGPLYLLIIGIPSLIGNIIHRFIKFDYYKLPWEKWANNLAGIPF